MDIGSTVSCFFLTWDFPPPRDVKVLTAFCLWCRARTSSLGHKLYLDQWAPSVQIRSWFAQKYQVKT